MSRIPSTPFNWLALVLAIASMLGTAYAEYNHNDRDTIQRLSVLEAHQNDNSNRLDRIESKLDHLIEGLGVR